MSTLKLDVREVRAFYLNGFTSIPEAWTPKRLARKHYRVELFNGRFLKVNRVRPRYSVKSLSTFCYKYAPVHIYMSVLEWLMPERVTEKGKSNRAYPIGGEYVVDVDSMNMWTPHSHYYLPENLCLDCLENSRKLTLHILDRIEENHSKVRIVFSGRKGFHIHVQDFDLRDWTYYSDRDPIKSHEVARFKYTKWLESRCYGFNRAHFVLSVDPMRMITVPNSINADSGLVAKYVGDRKDLEHLSIPKLIGESKPTEAIYGHEFVTVTQSLRARR